MRYSSRSKGYALVEVLIGATLFAMLSVSVYQGYGIVIRLVAASRHKVNAMDIANERIELIRNMPYAQVGLVGGIPPGVLPATTTVTRNAQQFLVTTTVRNVDDPFDGTIGGSPNDLSPADYKLVQVDIDCQGCQNFPTMSVSTRVAPKNLETASTNGALFIRVFNASGVPVPQAQVTITNTKTSPQINLTEETDNQGMLQIVDAPPSATAYQISVTKSGYTTDATIATSTSNPNPTKPHATVLLQQVTQTSFVIDQLSTASVRTMSPSCAPVPSTAFTLSGSKLVGTSPDVLKFSGSYTTDGSGRREIPGLEWDTYAVSLSGGVYLAGTSPLLPVSLAPGAVQDVQLIVSNSAPNHLLVTVKDSATGLPLSGADVVIAGPETRSLVTGRGFLTQTDWSGGSGQTTFGDMTRYDGSDGNVAVSQPAGDMRLASSFGIFAPSGELTSSVFDTGTTTNFNQISWAPVSQVAQVGSGSARFQIATSPDNDISTTWAYRGPDGTAGTYYDTTNTNISSVHNGDRYLRYKAFLATASTTYSPTISDVSFTVTNECNPPGQVFFSGIPQGTYTLTVLRSGYANHSSQVAVSSAWQQVEVAMVVQ